MKFTRHILSTVSSHARRNSLPLAAVAFAGWAVAGDMLLGGRDIKRLRAHLSDDLKRVSGFFGVAYNEPTEQTEKTNTPVT